ncbi:hypothetical protein WJX72_010001 [[Myrmecia] bisecta]|uniref:Uncharacterized protein n=1 Tax=[Myrmecia] bisecta TaxID=41462 RepID=A0AAW1R939_9CHLO
MLAGDHSGVLPLTEIAVQAVVAGDFWRVQKKSLLTLPDHLGNWVLELLLEQGRLAPPQLELFRNCATTVCIASGYAHGSGGDWLAALGKFRSLQELHLHHWAKLRPDRLAPLAPLAPCLQQLHLPRCSGLTEQALDHIGRLTAVTDLDISGTGISGSSGALALLTSLTSLNLSDTRLNGSDCHWLAKLVNLRSLGVAATSIGDPSLQDLTHLALTSLDLTWTRVTQAPSMPSLQCLTMASCDLESPQPCLTRLVLTNVEVADVHWLADASRLQHLDLSGTKISDSSSECLQQLHALEWLSLSHTAVTESLRQLDLSHSHFIGSLMPAPGWSGFPQLQVLKLALELTGPRLTVQIVESLRSLTLLQFLTLQKCWLSQ